MSIEQSSLNSPLALDPERRDRLRRRRLTRNRLLASALLAAMATIYVATHAVAGPGSWILLLRAGAEAGVVGGLADWFAVTALFRHPLGLPSWPAMAKRWCATLSACSRTGSRTTCVTSMQT